MHRATLHDYITRTADRLLQLALRVRIGWIIGLGRSYEHHRARQKYIVISCAGPVLGRAAAVSKLRPEELQLSGNLPWEPWHQEGPR